jgi:hypothetical protein
MVREPALASDPFCPRATLFCFALSQLCAYSNNSSDALPRAFKRGFIINHCKHKNYASGQAGRGGPHRFPVKWEQALPDRFRRRPMPCVKCFSHPC